MEEPFFNSLLILPTCIAPTTCRSQCVSCIVECLETLPFHKFRSSSMSQRKLFLYRKKEKAQRTELFVKIKVNEALLFIAPYTLLDCPFLSNVKDLMDECSSIRQVYSIFLVSNFYL